MKMNNAARFRLACVGCILASMGIAQSAISADLPKPFRIGVLSAGSTWKGQPPYLITSELRKLGYIEGENVVFEFRGANGDPDRLPDAAAELVKLNVDLIIALANQQAFAAKRATRSIPIVVWGAHGALETGLVDNLRRPGGNVTGIDSLAPAVDSKRLEILKELVPRLKNVTVIYDSDDLGSAVHLKSARAAAQAFGIAVNPIPVRRDADVAQVFSSLAGKTIDGLLPFNSPIMFRNWPKFLEFSMASRLPTICEWRELVKAGCLISYGSNINEYAQRNAAQIDKILKGALPGDLPIEQMSKFELVINLKTAKALGVAIPQSLLIRANELID